ncbi:MAG: WG repeat-containing protein [Spirochaetales bacterium]|nr:WG repeat-containing protein [Spirochaetales bacterium]
MKIKLTAHLCLVLILLSAASCISTPAGMPAPVYSYGYIDETGKIIVPLEYKRVSGFSENRAFLFTDNSCICIDTSGRTVFTRNYINARPYSQSLAAVQDKSGSWGYIDLDGTEVIGLRFDDAGNFSLDRAPVKSGGKWGVIDKFGTFMVMPMYDKIREHREYLMPAAKQTGWDNDIPLFKWGYITGDGKVRIEFQFDDAWPFYNNRARVVKREARYISKTGYIDANGSLVIPFTFVYARDFIGDSAAVSNGKDWGIIDKKGSSVRPLSSTFEIDPARSLNLVYSGGMFGYADKDGNTVIEPQFDFAEQFSNGRAVAGKKK